MPQNVIFVMSFSNNNISRLFKKTVLECTNSAQRGLCGPEKHSYFEFRVILNLAKKRKEILKVNTTFKWGYLVQSFKKK